MSILPKNILEGSSFSENTDSEKSEILELLNNKYFSVKQINESILAVINNIVNVDNINQLDSTLREITIKYHDRLINSKENLLLADYDKLNSYDLFIKTYHTYIFRPNQVYEWNKYYNYKKLYEFLLDFNQCNTTKIKSLTKFIDSIIHCFEDLVSKVSLTESSDLIMKEISKFNSKLNSIVIYSKDFEGARLRYNDFFHKKVKPYVNFDKSVIDQKIYIEINPLDDQLNPKEVKLTTITQKYENLPDHMPANKGFILNKYHIENFKICMNVYGFEGTLKFTLSYDRDKFHKDFAFLYNNNPFSALIYISQYYGFPDDDNKDEPFQDHFTLKAISFITTNVNNIEFNNIRSYPPDKNNKNSRIESYDLEFTMHFYDPLKAFWMSHKPLAFFNQMSYSDILEEYNSFEHLANIDFSQSKILTKKIPQIFCNCAKTSFYDYFIEILDAYQIYLIYDYDSDQSGQYVLMDSEKDLQTKYKPKSEDPFIYSFYDIDRIISIKAKTPQPVFLSNNIYNLSYVNSVLDIDSESHLEYVLNIKQITNTKIYKIDDKMIWDSSFKQQEQHIENDFSTRFRFSIHCDNVMPKAPKTPSYSSIKLDKSQWESTIYNFLEKVLSYKITMVLTKNSFTQRYINNQKMLIVHKDAQEESKFEKISFIPEKADNTFKIDFDLTWCNADTTKRFLPEFKPMPEFMLQGIIVTSDKESLNSDKPKYDYKYFKGASGQEGSYEESIDSKIDSYNRNLYSENDIYYKVNIFDKVFNKKCQDSPYIYAPKIHKFESTNHFESLRNGDIVELTIKNSETAVISHATVSAARFTKKASVTQRQQSLYGINQECEFSYTSNDDNVFRINQEKKNEGINEFLLSDSNGIQITFSDKKDEKK